MQRFLTRLSLHPVLRRADILHKFLESPDWYATMRSESSRGSMSQEGGSGGVFDNLADSFMNAFTKVHKPDKRFVEVKEKADKLEDDLSHIEKVMTRVGRRHGDIEADYHDLAEQFHKLVVLEPGVSQEATAFAASAKDQAAILKKLKDHEEQDYLGSLRDMQTYSQSLKNLLKAREQKQLDYEQLTDYLHKSTIERDQLMVGNLHGSSGPGSFIRSKIEDVRGVDHEAARRERLRKLELRIEELTLEVETTKKQMEAFDEEVVREVEDFERIKRVEFKKQLGGLCKANVEHNDEVITVWEKYIAGMEAQGVRLPDQ